MAAPLLYADPAWAPGRLLVKPAAGADVGAAAKVLGEHGATVRRTLSLPGPAVAEVPEETSATVMESLRRTGLFAYVERDYYARTAASPNDPSYPLQWYLPRIQAPEAWDLTTGSAEILVAVIDSGADGTHPDLASRLAPGWNFVQSNADTSDALGHGTEVAGTIAASADNHIGVAGITWRSSLMPLVVVDRNDYAAYSDIALALRYAADRGARVINISIGGPNISAALQDAVDYAWNKGAVIFAAAMNDGSATPYYPAACSHVLAISATDANDRLAGFSNFGNWIALAAPGTNILTTVAGGGYGYLSGTSFAAPIAAGVAALALAENPALTNAAVAALLEQNADASGSAPPDIWFGWGRVNAYKTVLAARPHARTDPVASVPVRRRLP